MPDSHTDHDRWYGSRVDATRQDSLPVLAGRILDDIVEAHDPAVLPPTAGFLIGISGRVLTVGVLVPRHLVRHDPWLPLRIGTAVRVVAAPYNWSDPANERPRRFYLEVDLRVVDYLDSHFRVSLLSSPEIG